MLACLRMILAHQGISVTEAELVEQVSLAEGGLDPEVLAGLARTYGLQADARQMDFGDIVDFIDDGRFPIVLIDRSSIDREFSIHAVIPVRISRVYVRVLDPLRGERRISRPKFRRAHRRVGRWAVVWDTGGR
jgi:ABC-type bacteriocin/lantibiotic exporter with double-glycine peptidase domain